MDERQWDGSGPSPSEEWDRDFAKRTLDDLFYGARQYRKSADYLELMRFITRFRRYSPFNAMLVHIQKPGSVFVAPPYRWHRDYERTIKPDARPLIILQPMGPVMIVFDVSDTEGMRLPRDVTKPFEATGAKVDGRLERTIYNSIRDGVKVYQVEFGSQQGASIELTRTCTHGVFRKQKIPVRYDLKVNKNGTREDKYASLVHELAHLYCGHLGTPHPEWWPNRRGLDPRIMEFEAESVSYLVCSRAGIWTSSESYLSGYTQDFSEIPPISLDCVLKAGGLVERMGGEALDVRKTPKARPSFQVTRAQPGLFTQ